AVHRCEDRERGGTDTIVHREYGLSGAVADVEWRFCRFADRSGCAAKAKILAISPQNDKFDTAARAQFPDRLPDSRNLPQAEAIAVVRTGEADCRGALRGVLFYTECAFCHLKSQASHCH